MTPRVPRNQFIFGSSAPNVRRQVTGYRLQEQCGFTLLELLVTLGIMTLIVAAALLNVQTSHAHQQLLHAAEDVRLMVYQAHNFALAPEPTKARATDRYRFQVIVPNVYRVVEVTSQVPADPVGAVVRTAVLPEGISFTGTGTPGSVALSFDFSILDQGRIVAPDPLGQPTAVMSLRRTRPPEDQVQLLVQLLTGQVEVVGD
ncbi:type II secretion system protein [Candidatus Berkelbacteria bacterium]|nr:type II secretion system protein [Candidatus Berkelbacteria bacterium]